MDATRGFRRGRTRRLWLVGATMLAAAAFGVVFIASSGAAPLPSCPTPGNFEIDGDMTQHTCAQLADDWDTPGIGVQSTTQGGTYSTSNKDNSDPSNWTSSGSTPNKTDFAQAYATSRVVGGHFYVFVAWERTDTTGTQGYAIEITNAGTNTGSDGTPQPIRSNGGDVFYLSSQGAAQPAFDSACSYTSQSTYGKTCTSSNASVTAAINTASISDPLNHTTQPKGGFFEIALDVTGLTGITPSCPGATANTVYLRSITGQTSNGNLKGYMAPLEVAPDSTCVPPPITTTATPGGSTNPPGTAQHDTVTVGQTGAFGVGTVKFFLCSPAEVTANGGDCSANGTQVGQAVTLNSSGGGTSDTVDGSTTPNDTAPGTYCWRAEFTPSANDHNYLPGSHTNGDSECFKILAQPGLTTAQNPTSGPLGALYKDKATLAGAASPDGSGTITFTLYPNNDCTGTPLDTETVSGISANGVVETPVGVTLSNTGTYYWFASYSGDSNNLPASSGCADEPVVVAPNQPSIVTTQDPASGPIGGLYKDQADLEGATNLDGKGTITWTLYPHNDCTGTPLDTETSSGISSNGVVETPTGVTLQNAGTYYWEASFSGDSNNLSAKSACSDEPVVVNPNQPEITTSQDPASGSAGDIYKDHATLSNTVNQDGSGSITWTLYPNQDCTGTALDTETVSVDADGTFETPNGVAVNKAGTYYWVASFSGDSNNLSATSGCAEEPVQVKGAVIHVAKSADKAQVSVGQAIGFTMTVWNDGNGDAKGVTLKDTLPKTPGLSWTVAGQGSGWGSPCSISNGVLSCGPVTVPAGTTQEASTYTVHITSGTTAATAGDCPDTGVVDNTADVTTSNDGSDESSASTCVQAMVDLAVTKAGSPATQDLTSSSNITWTIVVTNNGPNADPGVTVADPMPAGNTFVSVKTDKPGATCTGGAVLHCDLGTMAAGDRVTITLVTTPSTVGNQVNTVNVVGGRPETDTTNNTATATVVTTQVFTPPPVFCVAVSKVTPNQLFVGRKTKLTIHVTKHGKAVKGVHVRIQGPKVDVRTKASNARGVITRTLKMKKAGILVFSPIASKRCNTKRVGVTNVFTPPVTG
jgi:uncharacterized repeat protein (TIGR01451 family)